MFPQKETHANIFMRRETALSSPLNGFILFTASDP